MLRIIDHIINHVIHRLVKFMQGILVGVKFWGIGSELNYTTCVVICGEMVLLHPLYIGSSCSGRYHLIHYDWDFFPIVSGG